MKLRAIITLAIFAHTAIHVHAQWTDNMAVNTQITPNSLSFLDPEMQTSPNGESFLFFQVPLNDQGKFSMRLQVVSKDGKRLFPSGGTTVAQENHLSFTRVNQSMMLDNEGNAILAIYDQRASTDGKSFDYYIYKYSPEGKLLWGPIALNGGEPSVGMWAITMCPTDDGGYAFAYVNGNGVDDVHIAVEKLSTDGVVEWKEPVVFNNKAGYYTYPYIKSCGDGSMMLLYTDQSSTVYARALDNEGKEIWNNPTTVYDGGFGSQKIWDVMSVSNGLNGSVLFCCMDNSYCSRLVQLNADGTIATEGGTKGVKLNADGYGADMPFIACDEQNGVYYASFGQFDTKFTEYGVFVTKFSSEGQRLWKEAQAVVGMEENCQIHNSAIRLSTDNRLALFFQKMEGTGDKGPVGNYIATIDSTGQTFAQPFNFSTTKTTKKLLWASPLINNSYFVAGWTEKRTGSTSECYFMQHVMADIQTGITNPTATGREASSVTIYGVDGSMRQGLAKGVNIMLIKHVDGTIETQKIIKN